MLRRLYDDDSSKDVTFVLDSRKTFTAHRCVLKVSTVDWLQTIVQSNFKEATSSIIKISDCSDNVFEIALMWAYELVDNRKPMQDTFLAADRFLAPSLIQHYADAVIETDDTKYVEFLVEMMKYPLIFKDVLKTVYARRAIDIIHVLRRIEYQDRAEEILVFMVKNYIFETKAAQYFLECWLDETIVTDRTFGKSPLDMREFTAILLRRGRFFAINGSDLYTLKFKKDYRRLVDKGYYQQSDIDKLYAEESKPYMIVSSYPLRLGRLIPIDKALRAHEKILFMFHQPSKQRVKTWFSAMGVDGYYNIIEV
jgi:hypothetical protein